MRLATPRLGDAGTRAILEFVGKNDRVVQRSEKPQFGGDEDESEDEELVAGDDAADESSEIAESASEEVASENAENKQDD